MSEKQDYFEVIRRARRDVWNIVICLLRENIETDMILHILMVKQEEIEEVRSVFMDIKKTDLIKIAISLAKDATLLGLTACLIEEKTGVDRSVFEEYLDKGQGEENER